MFLSPLYTKGAYVFGLLGLVLFSLALYVHVNTEDVSPGQFPLLDPTAATVTDQDRLVKFQPLRVSLHDKYEMHEKYLISLYFEYLPTGASVSINKDVAMWPASLIKIPVAMAVMKKIERGEWTMTNELVILDEDKDSSFGTLYTKPTGTTMMIKDLLRETLSHSDNTAHFVLLRNLDSSDLENVFTHLGLDEVLESLQMSPEHQGADNRMTAKTYSVFFRSLFNATFLSPVYSDEFLSILLEGPREYMAANLPTELPVAHKTGIRSEDRVWADAGIVYLPRRPYLYTVMIQQRGFSEPIDQAEVDALFGEISRDIYTYVENL